MVCFHLIFTICTSLLMFTACSRSSTAIPKTEETLKSATEQASKTVQSALDQAKSATDKATQTAQSTIDKAKFAADKATQSASEAVKDVMTFKEGLQGMSTGVSNTLTAINSDNFTAAQQEFSQVQGNWAKIGDTVQTKSTKIYQQVDSHLTTITTLLKEPNRDRPKLVTELNALGKTLTDSLPQFELTRLRNKK